MGSTRDKITMKLLNEQQSYNPIPVEKLPVPSLQKTMQQYLQSVKPFLNKKELQVTTSLVQEFLNPGGIGYQLQAVLEERARSRDNWLEEWWLNYAYMDYRKSIVINSNTSVTFKTKEIRSIEEQLNIAASLIVSVLNFKQILDEFKLPQHKMGKFALDMSQYYNVFGACRIPGEKRDTLRLFRHGEHRKHIIVMHNFHFFVVPVYGNDGTRLNQDQILEQLRIVVAESPEPSSTPVGILTSEKRDTWHQLRQTLLKEPENRDALEMIETSIVIVSLDAKPIVYENLLDKRNEIAARNVFCGGGINSSNRWFDKAVNYVIGYYGALGVECEHSPSDGIVSNPLCDNIVDRLDKKDDKISDTKFYRPRKLNFKIHELIHKAIRNAQISLEREIDNLEMNCYLFQNYGVDFIKSRKFSPDSYIQMAIQLAYYRFYGKCGAQYESASLRRYIHGRTEAIRSCSEEAVRFCNAMLNTATTVEEKRRCLDVAVKKHREIVLQAVSCEGIDRHMLGLRMAAQDLGIEMPQLFLDPGFTRSTHFCLSTSQVPFHHGAFNFFGPVVTDGYGICYNPHPHEISFGITAFNSCPSTSASILAQSLEQSFLDMRRILIQPSNL